MENARDAALADEWELDRVVAHLLGRPPRTPTVALQFPDELLHVAPRILKLLDVRLRAAAESAARAGDGGGATHNVPRLVILGDTTFGSCCVDEVAAAHVSAEVVVHFGHACMSPTSTVRSLCVYGDRRRGGDATATATASASAAAPLDPAACGRALASLLPPPPRATPAATASSADHQQQQEQQQQEQPRALLVWDPDCTRAISQILEHAADAAGLPRPAPYPSPCPPNEWRWRSPDPARLVVPRLSSLVEPPSAARRRREERVSGPAGATVAGPEADGRTKEDPPQKGGEGEDWEGEEEEGELVVCGMRTGLLDPDLAQPPSPSASPPPPSSAPPGPSRRLDSAPAQGMLHVVYVGSRAARARMLAGRFATERVTRVDPSTGACEELAPRAVGRLMSARYRAVEVVRGARALGLVAGTLGVARHTALLARLRRACVARGKGCYTLLVGKPSPVKLGNFPELDAFVVVACPEGCIPGEEESRAYASPIVTPHEALVALEGGTGGFGAEGEGADGGGSGGGGGGGGGGESGSEDEEEKERRLAKNKAAGAQPGRQPAAGGRGAAAGVASGRAVRWTGRAVVDIAALVAAPEGEGARRDGGRGGAESESEAPHLSLVTGRLNRPSPWPAAAAPARGRGGGGAEAGSGAGTGPLVPRSRDGVEGEGGGGGGGGGKDDDDDDDDGGGGGGDGDMGGRGCTTLAARPSDSASYSAALAVRTAEGAPSAAASFLARREWRGLEYDAPAVEAAAASAGGWEDGAGAGGGGIADVLRIHEGTVGIARGYEREHQQRRD